MQIAHDAKVRVIFDLDVSPSFFAESELGTQAELCSALRLVDVLKPCKAAARELTGEADYEKVATALLRMGPSVVAITLGVDGCLIATPKEVAKVPAFKVDVVDTTGAGDAFMGGLSFALLQGWNIEKVGLFANACAALCCTKIGARAMARHDEVVALIKKQSPKGAAAF
jgi:sugar/nucleoside kinase (ribokinase family)